MEGCVSSIKWVRGICKLPKLFVTLQPDKQSEKGKPKMIKLSEKGKPKMIKTI